jgi:hypothetical protein
MLRPKRPGVCNYAMRQNKTKKSEQEKHQCN